MNLVCTMLWLQLGAGAGAGAVREERIDRAQGRAAK